MRQGRLKEDSSGLTNSAFYSENDTPALIAESVAERVLE
jgi:hypothetical protein